MHVRALQRLALLLSNLRVRSYLERRFGGSGVLDRQLDSVPGAIDGRDCVGPDRFQAFGDVLPRQKVGAVPTKA